MIILPEMVKYSLFTGETQIILVYRITNFKQKALLFQKDNYFHKKPLKRSRVELVDRVHERIYTSCQLRLLALPTGLAPMSGLCDSQNSDNPTASPRLPKLKKSNLKSSKQSVK